MDVYSSINVAVGGVVIGATKHGEVQTFCRWVKNIKQNMLIDTISHPHIASAPHHQCIKDARGMDVLKEGVGQCDWMLPWGCRDVDANASNGEWFFIHKKINWYLLALLLLHIVVEGTTEMCVQLVCWIANDKGLFGRGDGAAVMMEMKRVKSINRWWARKREFKKIRHGPTDNSS
jgi:hypothetical protein